MTEQTKEQPTGSAAAGLEKAEATVPRAGTEQVGAEEAGVAEPVGEAGSSTPETAVPGRTEQTEPAKPDAEPEQDLQPSAPTHEPPLPSEPTPVPAAAPASALTPGPASASGPLPPVPEAAPVPEPGPALVPGTGAPLPSEPTPVPAAAPASALTPAPAPASASGPLPPVPEAAPAPEPAATPDPAPKNRRTLRATLRWTAALLTFAAFGAGSAYGVAGMERTDVPGLGTVSDGRWVYPVLTKAPLPSGSPGPLVAENKAGSHYADLRALVLPAPEGATVDKALSGTDGWLPTKDLLAEYAEKEDRDELGTKLSENGLRHIAARGWTTPDGTRTRIYLLQFDTAAVVDALFGQDIAPYGSPGYELRDAPDSASDEAFPDAARIHDITASVYVESKPYGKEQARHAYIGAGDVLALVVQSRKGTANSVPFQQTVTLQSQLLG